MSGSIMSLPTQTMQMGWFTSGGLRIFLCQEHQEQPSDDTANFHVQSTGAIILKVNLPTHAYSGCPVKAQDQSTRSRPRLYWVSSFSSHKEDACSAEASGSAKKHDHYTTPTFAPQHPRTSTLQRQLFHDGNVRTF